MFDFLILRSLDVLDALASMVSTVANPAAVSLSRFLSWGFALVGVVFGSDFQVGLAAYLAALVSLAALLLVVGGVAAIARGVVSFISAVRGGGV